MHETKKNVKSLRTINVRIKCTNGYKMSLNAFFEETNHYIYNFLYLSLHMYIICNIIAYFLLFFYMILMYFFFLLHYILLNRFPSCIKNIFSLKIKV